MKISLTFDPAAYDWSVSVQEKAVVLRIETIEITVPRSRGQALVHRLRRAAAQLDMALNNIAPPPVAATSEKTLILEEPVEVSAQPPRVRLSRAMEQFDQLLKGRSLTEMAVNEGDDDST